MNLMECRYMVCKHVLEVLVNLNKVLRVGILHSVDFSHYMVWKEPEG